MKKRVAIFANGWSNDFVQSTVDGISKSAKGCNADLFMFLSFCAYSESDKHNLGESNIFKLPDFTDFDGVILLPGTFNVDYEMDYVFGEIERTGIPAVTIEYQVDDIVNVTTDTYTGMCELVERVYKERNVSKVMYMGGFVEHEDTQKRLRAVLDVSKKYGITIDDDYIIFADWARALAYDIIAEWCKSGKELPDVVFCANDIMARGVIDCFERYGYMVPDDILVTGYDCTKLGQQREPSLMTVKHDYKSMGYAAMSILSDKMNGIERNESVVVGSQTIDGESCGFERDMDLYNEMRAEMEKLELDGLGMDSHYRHMYVAVRKVKDLDSFNKGFDKLFEHEHWIEGDDLIICVEPEFFDMVDGEENLRMRGYDSEMYVVCNLSGGIGSGYKLEDRKKIIYSKALEKEETGLYIYLPIHSDGKNYGFSMLTCGVGRLENNYLYIWTRHIDQLLEQVRRNLEIEYLTKKLTDMSVTDMLTGVYNRTGCEQIMYPMIHDNHDKGKTSVMIMIDVDRLKYINDVYGHADGDIAIKTVAAAVKEVLPAYYVIARFGGDEFLAAGECESEEYIKNLINLIEERLLEKINENKFEFTLSASIGYTMISPDEPVDIKEYVCKADECMYAVKKRHHENR